MSTILSNATAPRWRLPRAEVVAVLLSMPFLWKLMTPCKHPLRPESQIRLFHYRSSRRHRRSGWRHYPAQQDNGGGHLCQRHVTAGVVVDILVGLFEAVYRSSVLAGADSKAPVL